MQSSVSQKTRSCNYRKNTVRTSFRKRKRKQQGGGAVAADEFLQYLPAVGGEVGGELQDVSGQAVVIMHIHYKITLTLG